MIVYVDANVLMQDPMFSGAVWQVLAHAPASWRLQLFTSEVAVSEAVAGYARALDAAAAGLEKVAKPWLRLGIRSELEALLKGLTGRVDSYEAHLRLSLSAARMEILPPPAVPHIDVVARSVARRRPCDVNGNGYRDTLHWLTLLQLTTENSSEHVVLVTTDSDFMDESKTALHPDLLQEIDAIGAADRVRLVSILADIPLELAERSADEGAVQALRAELKDETVRTYVTTLVEGLLGSAVDARSCALPPVAASSLIQAIGPIGDLTYEIKGRSGEDEAVAEFSFKAETEVLLSLPTDFELELDDRTQHLADGASERLYLRRKPLSYSGFLQLGRYDRPLGGEVSRIVARDDDPDRNLWTSMLGAAYIRSLFAGMMQNCKPVTLPDIMQNYKPVSLMQTYKPILWGNIMQNYKPVSLGEIMQNYKPLLWTDIMKKHRPDKPSEGQQNVPPEDG